MDRRLRQLPDRRDRGPGRWRINDAVAALAGGLVAGAVIGAGQWLAGRRLLGDPLAWIAATAAGMGIGLLAGARLVDYGTSVGELAAIGAITGVPLGAVQLFLLRDRVARSWVWAEAMPLLWALGWTITAAGVGVDRQYAVFGAFGAVTVMALGVGATGLLFGAARTASRLTGSGAQAAALCGRCLGRDGN